MICLSTYGEHTQLADLVVVVGVVDERRLALPADVLLAARRLVDDGQHVTHADVVGHLFVVLAGAFVTLHLRSLLTVVSCHTHTHTHTH